MMMSGNDEWPFDRIPHVPTPLPH